MINLISQPATTVLPEDPYHYRYAIYINVANLYDPSEECGDLPGTDQRVQEALLNSPDGDRVRQIVDWAANSFLNYRRHAALIVTCEGGWQRSRAIVEMVSDKLLKAGVSHRVTHEARFEKGETAWA